MKIGVIGVGVISTALIKGLEAKLGGSVQFFLSPRNAEKSASLRDTYDNIVVTGSNQEVVDRSEVVILAVLPEGAREVVASLSFRPEQHVISLISEPKLSDLAEWIGPCETLTRVIPLTVIERHMGPVVVYPATPLVCDLLDGLGDVVIAGSEESFKLAQAQSAVMGAFYYLTDEIVNWAERRGDTREVAAQYAFSLFKALADQGQRTDPAELSQLWREMTPGGLNEGVIRTIKEADGFSLWIRALDGACDRIS